MFRNENVYFFVDLEVILMDFGDISVDIWILRREIRDFVLIFGAVPLFCIGDQNLELSHLLTKISPSSEGVRSKTRYLDICTHRELLRKLVFIGIGEVENSKLWCCNFLTKVADSGNQLSGGSL